MSSQLGTVARHPARWLHERRHRRGLVLMYHAVGEVRVDPWELFVSPENFDNHLRVIREIGHPLSLRELAVAQSLGRLPANAFALTFDDGYANNLHEALPLLERYEIPATIYVIAGGVGSDREFWWDELCQLVTAPADLPTHPDPAGPLELTTPTGTLRYDLSAGDHPLRARLGLYHRLWEHFSTLDPAERDLAMAQVAAWAGSSPRRRETHRPLDHSELALLDKHPLIDIGAHTVTHPLLPTLAAEDQLFELSEGAAILERVVGHPIDAFSYPFGAHDEMTVEAARSAGFDSACSTRPQAVTVTSERLRLPRMDVKNWSRRGFRRRVRHWLRYR